MAYMSLLLFLDKRADSNNDFTYDFINFSLSAHAPPRERGQMIL